MKTKFTLFVSILIVHFWSLIEAIKGNAGDVDLDAVVESVKKEISALGDNSKKNYDELRRGYEELKQVMSDRKPDAIAEEKFNKLGTDILTRQEELDKKNATIKAEIHKRIDDVELMLKRPPMGNGQESGDLTKEAKEFYISAMAARGIDGGAAERRVKELKINTDEYLKYKEAFLSLCRYGKDTMSAEEHKTMLVGSDPDGGLTVTPYMSSRIIQKLFEMDPIRQLAAVETISTGAYEMMTDLGEFECGWESETVLGNRTNTSQLGMKRVPVHNMYARPAATQTLIEDSAINIENFIADKVARRMSRREAADFVTGDGVGKPRGFLTYADGSTTGTVQQVHMGAAAALTADGFYNVKYSLLEDYLSAPGLAWLMQRSTVLAALKLKDGAGNYLWQPAFIAGQPSMIISIPVRMSPSMPTIAAGSLSVALADWKEAYLIVDRLGITVQRDPYTLKPLIEFYTRKRLGGDIVSYDAIKIGTIEA
jgi:HK97 family phage major capsid protein